MNVPQSKPNAVVQIGKVKVGNSLPLTLIVNAWVTGGFFPSLTCNVTSSLPLTMDRQVIIPVELISIPGGASVSV